MVVVYPHPLLRNHWKAQMVCGIAANNTKMDVADIGGERIMPILFQFFGAFNMGLSYFGNTYRH